MSFHLLRSVICFCLAYALGASAQTIESKRLKVTLRQSSTLVVPGKQVSLFVDITLAPGMHVYAPSIEPPYKPIKLTIDPEKGTQISPVRYPQAKKLHLQAIDETVPVYEGEFRLEADALVRPSARAGESVINGTLSYQTCDDKICYLPVNLPVSWTIQVTPKGAKAAPRK